MSPSLPEPPPLEGVTLHVLVRECPETLPLLRERGIDVAASGADPVDTLPEAVLEEVRAAVRWRTREP